MTMRCCECGSEMLWDGAIHGFACLICCSSVVVPGEYNSARCLRVTEAAQRVEYLEELAKKKAKACSCGENT